MILRKIGHILCSIIFLKIKTSLFEFLTHTCNLCERLSKNCNVFIKIVGPTDDHQLARLAKNQLCCFTQLAEMWKETGVEASDQTAYRRLHEQISAAHTSCKTFAQCQTTVEAAEVMQGEKDWMAEQWSSVLFFDHFKFVICFGLLSECGEKRANGIWSAKCEVVMVGCTMLLAGVSGLCFLKSFVNAAVYKDILKLFMVPVAEQLYGDDDSSSSRSLLQRTVKSTQA